MMASKLFIVPQGSERGVKDKGKLSDQNGGLYELD
jgi:hypothetical protein